MLPLEGLDIVCISVMDWEHPFQSSRHHLMRALARRNRVLFVDNQFNPLNVLKRINQAPMRRKLTSWARLSPNPRLVEDNLWVYNPPPVIPMGQLQHRAAFEPVYAANQAMLRAGIRRACRQLGFERPVLWISFNVLSSESLIGALNERLVVYHCTDEITAMAGVSPFVGEIERRLLAKAGLVFTSSKQLLEDKVRYNPRCHWVPNGADTALFEQALAPETPLHPTLREIATPVIGFAGHMEERFDFALMHAVAESHPAWTFVLAGPIAPSRRAEADRLVALPNVRHVGLLPRHELPSFLKGCDVALIPFVHSAQTRAIYPLKLNEYLAAGRPVVLTPFSDLREFEGLVSIADDAPAFGAAIARELAANSPERTAERVAMARGNSWENRAEQMGAILAESLGFGRAEATA